MNLAYLGWYCERNVEVDTLEFVQCIKQEIYIPFACIHPITKTAEGKHIYVGVYITTPIESIHFTHAWLQTKEVIPVVFPIQSI